MLQVQKAIAGCYIVMGTVCARAKFNDVSQLYLAIVSCQVQRRGVQVVNFTTQNCDVYSTLFGCGNGLGSWLT